MDERDELRRLREDMDALMAKAALLSLRLERMEREHAAPGMETDPAASPPNGATEPTSPPAMTPEAHARLLRLLDVDDLEMSDTPERPAAEPSEHAAPPGHPFLERPRPLEIPSMRSRWSVLREKMIKQAGLPADASWETLLGTYVLPRIGILAVSLAVVFLLTLAIRAYGPGARIAMGYGVCVALLGVGWWLEKRFALFARVLYSGGIALSYFVTFAAHHVEFARVIENRRLDLALLAGVVLVWAVVAQWRKSRMVATIVMFLGGLTVFLAGPQASSRAGLLILALGSAFFLLYNRWYFVAVLGMAACYINYAVWLIFAGDISSTGVFVDAMVFLAAYFVLFAVAELVAPAEMRRKAVPVWQRSLFVTLNSASFFSLATLLMYRFAETRAHQDIFRFIYAVVLVALALAYLRIRGRDPLYNVYLTKGIAVATLGLAARYSGSPLAAWFAVETVVLLVSARRSGLIITRFLAISLGALAFVHGLYTVFRPLPVWGYDGYWLAVGSAAFCVLGFLGAGVLYERTRWPRLTAAPEGRLAALTATLRALDLLDAPQNAQAPKEGRWIPYAYALAGAALLALFAARLSVLSGGEAALAASAAGLAVAAALLRSLPLGGAAHLAFASATLMVSLRTAGIVGGQWLPLTALDVANASVVVLSFLLIPLLLRRTRAEVWSPGAGAQGPTSLGDVAPAQNEMLRRPMGMIYALAGGLLLSQYAWRLGGETRVAGLAGLAVLTLVLAAAALRMPEFVDAAIVPLATTLLFGTTTTLEFGNAAWSWHLAGVVAFAGAAVASEPRFSARSSGLAPLRDIPVPYLLYLSVAWLAGCLVHLEVPDLAGPALLSAMAVAAMALAFALHPRALALSAAGWLVWAQFYWLFYPRVHAVDVQHPWQPEMSWTLLGIALLALPLAGDITIRYARRIELPWLAEALPATAFVLLTTRFIVELSSHEWRPLWYAVEAGGFLAYAYAVRGKTPLALSVLSAAIGSGAVVALGKTPDAWPLVAGYASCAAMWVVFQRLYERAQNRAAFEHRDLLHGLLVGIATALLVLMFARLPQLREVFLTASWSLLALALFGLFLLFRQRFYRYAGLTVFLLAIGRAFSTDSFRLEGIKRAVAFAVLGGVLLLVGYGYFKAVALLSKPKDPEPPTPGTEKPHGEIR